MSSLQKYVIIYNTLSLTIILCTYSARTTHCRSPPPPRVYNMVKLIFRTTCIKKYFSNPTPLNYRRLHYVYFIQMCYSAFAVEQTTLVFTLFFDCSPTHRRAIIWQLHYNIYQFCQHDTVIINDKNQN